MGWINVHWGVPQAPYVSTSLPHQGAFTLDKVLKQKRVSLFPIQLTIKGCSNNVILGSIIQLRGH
jgi:hypothetical protein